MIARFSVKYLRLILIFLILLAVLNVFYVIFLYPGLSKIMNRNVRSGSQTWKAYVEMNAHIYDSDSVNYHMHYGWFHDKLVRKYDKASVIVESWKEGSNKLLKYINVANHTQNKKENVILFIYYVAEFDQSSTVESAINNVNIFKQAIHQKVGSTNLAFYWINVVGGASNPIAKYIDINLPNCAVVDWKRETSEPIAIIGTLESLDERLDLSNKFSAVFFSSSNVRGPISQINYGNWIGSFKHLLGSNNVGMVGATISCDSTFGPYVQPYMYAIKSTIIKDLIIDLAQHIVPGNAENIVRYYQYGVSKLVQRLKFNISSILDYNILKQPYFNGKCLSAVDFLEKYPPTPISSVESATVLLGGGVDSTAAITHSIAVVQAVLTSSLSSSSDPSEYCNIKPDDILFHKWGDSHKFQHPSGYICDSAISDMQQQLLLLYKSMKQSEKSSINQDTGGEEYTQQANDESIIVFPETIGGSDCSLQDLYRDYNNEKYNLSSSGGDDTTTRGNINTVRVTSIRDDASGDDGNGRSSKVCFIVRTTEKHLILIRQRKQQQLQQQQHNSMNIIRSSAAHITGLYVHLGIDTIVQCKNVIFIKLAFNI